MVQNEVEQNGHYSTVASLWAISTARCYRLEQMESLNCTPCQPLFYKYPLSVKDVSMSHLILSKSDFLLNALLLCSWELKTSMIYISYIIFLVHTTVKQCSIYIKLLQSWISFEKADTFTSNGSSPKHLLHIHKFNICLRHDASLTSVHSCFKSIFRAPSCQFWNPNSLYPWGSWNIFPNSCAAWCSNFSIPPKKINTNSAPTPDHD